MTSLRTVTVFRPPRGTLLVTRAVIDIGSFMSQLVLLVMLQFLDKVADVPGCASTELMVQTVQKMRRFLHFVDKVADVSVKCNGSAWSDRAENCGGSAVAALCAWLRLCRELLSPRSCSSSSG